MQPRDLSAHVEYQAGRGHEEVATAHGVDPEDVIPLASNENPLGPPDSVVSTIQANADRVHCYPKAAHTALRDRLADRWALPSEQIWLGNGGDGALDYLARAILRPDDRVLVPEPGFAYYAMSARFHHGRVATYQLDRERDFSDHATSLLDAYSGERIVYVTSPHNPTGAVTELDALARVAEETDPETLLVVDEAYAAFSSVPSARQLVDERDDIAVLRSFSKSHGLAGLRLGFAIVPGDWADAYRRVNTPFAVNELACRAGLAALDDEGFLERSIELATWGRDYIRSELAAPTWPSEGNFVLAAVGDGAAVSAALRERGVIVRDCSSFGLPDCIRISVGRRTDLREAIAACNAVIDGRRSQVESSCESA